MDFVPAGGAVGAGPPAGGGRRRRGDREVLAAIIFVATSGCTWNQLPPGFGLSGVTAFRRFTEWTEARVWAKLHRLVLDELGARGDLDWSRCAIDSVSVRALKGAADRTESDRPRQERIENPPHRGPPGLPLSIGISAANLHDSQALIPLVRGIPPIRSRRGSRRRRPPSCTATRDTTTATCGNGSLPAVSGTVLPARASSRPSGWAGTAGWWSGPCPGYPAAAACIAATSESRNTSLPSQPSPRPSYVSAD